MEKYWIILFAACIFIVQGQQSPSKCEFKQNGTQVPQCNCTCKDGKEGKDGAITQKQLVALVKVIKNLQNKVKHLEHKVTRSKSQSTLSMYLKLLSLKPKFKSMRRSRNAGGLFDPMQFYLEALKKEQEILELKGTPPPHVDPRESYMPDVLGGIIDNIPHVGVNGKIPQSVLPGGYDKISATDIQWQALHMSAAAACRSLSKGAGHAGIHNVVLLRNAAERKNCRHLCSLSWASQCNGEVSLWGIPGRGKKNGQEVGTFYNYGCDYGYNGGSEAWAKDRDISKDLYAGHQYFYSYCCCSFY